MGYFSNGSEGADYESRYCSRCIHYGGCAVWDAHLSFNYKDANNDASILHKLIPLSKDGLGNEECEMFSEGDSFDPYDHELSEYGECGCRHDGQQHRKRADRVYCTACGVFCSANDLLLAIGHEA